MNLTAIFGKYVGKEILNPSRMTCDVDPLMYEIEGVAAQNKLMIQVREPGKMYDRAMRTNRLQVHVSENTKGKFEITDFRIG